MTLSVDKYEKIYRDVFHIQRMGQYGWVLMLFFALTMATVHVFLVPPTAKPLETAKYAGAIAGILIIYFAIAIGAMRLSKVYAVVFAIFLAFVTHNLLKMAWMFATSGFLQLDETYSLHAGMTLFVLIEAYVLIVSAIALFRIATMPAETKDIVAEMPPGATRSPGVIARTLGVPTSLKNIGRKKLLVFVMFLISSLGYSVFSIGMLGSPIVPVLLAFDYSFENHGQPVASEPDFGEALDNSAAENDAGSNEFEPNAPSGPGNDVDVEAAPEEGQEPGAEELQDMPARPSLRKTLFILFAIVGASIPLASGARAAARKLARTSIKAVQELDTRPPILFLRAFGDDQVELAKARQRLIAAPYTVGHRRPTLDILLLEEGTDYGPVVALGNPKDPIPPYGAARGYFKDEDWQTAVERLTNDSQAIVICVDETNGVRWELDLIAARGLAKKTLFLFHPRYKAPDLNRDLCTKLAEKYALDIAELKGSSAEAPTLGFFFDGDSLRVARSTSFSSVAYLLTLRSFQRTKLGPPTAF